MKITQKDGIYYLNGRLDEFAKFDELLEATDPLHLNVGEVTAVNSIGIRSFLAFTLKWAPRKIEFYECTPEFIASINLVPQILGHDEDASHIHSYYVPYFCEKRKIVENHLFQASEIALNKDGEAIVPHKSCAQCDCAEGMELDVEKAEYFLFMNRGD